MTRIAPTPPPPRGSVQLRRYRMFRVFGHSRADAAEAADVSIAFAELTDKEERLPA